MHVRHIVRQFAPAVGGLENAVANLAASLRASGVDGSIVTLDRLFTDPGHRLPATDSVGGLPVVRLPWCGSSRYPLAPAVLRALDGADLVHVHGIDFFFDFLAATRAVHRKPLVASTHGGFFHTAFASRAKQAWFATITRASARGYRTIIASSESDAERFRTIAPRRTIAIENGVDVAKWRDAAARAAVPTMIFIGRFSSNKAIPALFPILAALPPAWRLIVAGVESDLGAPDLRAAATRAGVADRVEVHVGADDATLRALIGRASHVVSASRYEGFGLSVVEGLSAGLHAVVNDIPPFRRLVTRTGRGTIVNADNPVAAAAAIRAAHDALAADPAAARAANIAAADTFSWAGTARAFADEYARVLSGRDR